MKLKLMKLTWPRGDKEQTNWACACAFCMSEIFTNYIFIIENKQSIIALSHLSNYIFSIKWFQWNTQSSKNIKFISHPMSKHFIKFYFHITWLKNTNQKKTIYWEYLHCKYENVAGFCKTNYLMRLDVEWYQSR